MYTYLSSGPPSFRVMFRNEKTVPKMSLASSCAERAVRFREGRGRSALLADKGRVGNHFLE